MSFTYEGMKERIKERGVRLGGYGGVHRKPTLRIRCRGKG
jgi:hypothetical protein